MSTIILTPAELAAITRRDSARGQRRVLDALGVPYRVHPIDRGLIVSRAAMENALGATTISAVATAPETYEVDEEGIRGHGKAPAHH